MGNAYSFILSRAGGKLGSFGPVRPCLGMGAARAPTKVVADEFSMARGPVSMLVLAARCNLVAYPGDPVVIGEWLAHALSRVICWNVLHAVAGGDLAKQQSN